MAGRFLFARPLDNALRDALSVTLATGVAVAPSAVADIYDGHWVTALQLAGTAIDLVAEFAAPVSPAFVVIGHSNLTVKARLQGHTDNTFGGGTPDVDLEFGLPVKGANGFFTSPWLAPTSVPAKAFWRLHVTGNAHNIAIGEFLLATTLRSLDATFVHPGVDAELVGASIVHRTQGGAKLAYEQASGVEAMSGILRVDASEKSIIDGLIAAARFDVRPFFCVVREDVDDAWLVQLDTSRVKKPPVGLGPHLHDYSIPIEMCTRGLPWVDPDA